MHHRLGFGLGAGREIGQIAGLPGLGLHADKGFEHRIHAEPQDQVAPLHRIAAITELLRCQPAPDRRIAFVELEDGMGLAPAFAGAGLDRQPRQFARDDAFDIALDRGKLLVGLAGEGDALTHEVDPRLARPSVIEFGRGTQPPVRAQIEPERQRDFGRASRGFALEDTRHIARHDRAVDRQADEQLLAPATDPDAPAPNLADDMAFDLGRFDLGDPDVDLRRGDAFAARAIDLPQLAGDFAFERAFELGEVYVQIDRDPRRLLGKDDRILGPRRGRAASLRRFVACRQPECHQADSRGQYLALLPHAHFPCLVARDRCCRTVRTKAGKGRIVPVPAKRMTPNAKARATLGAARALAVSAARRRGRGVTCGSACPLPPSPLP